MLLQAFFELVSITSIFPLFSVLSDPSLIETNSIFKILYDLLKFNNLNYFLIALSIFSFFLITLRTIISFTSNFLISRFVRIRSHLISSRLFKVYVSQPYPFFLDKNSAEMGKTILTEVEQVVGGCIYPSLQIIAQLLISVSIVIAVIAINPLITFIPLCVILIMYGIIVFLIRNRTLKYGEDRAIFNAKRYKITQELFAGIKEVKLSNNESFYFNEFDAASLNYSRLFIKIAIFKDFPRYLLELISIGALFSIVIILLFISNNNMGSILPTISLFAFAGIRILPAFQKLYQSFITMRFNYSALKSLKNTLIKSEFSVKKKSTKIIIPNQKIFIKEVNYFYPKSYKPALIDINMNITAKTTVGIVGSTGSGKSTLVDIIVGLLDPSKGQIYIDDIPLKNKNKNHWQNSIGYVSQDIFISDDTIRKNIALGIEEEEIDDKRIEIAAKQANIYNFIENELSNKFETKLGERGIRVSGGQKQRIGLARAFYLDPPILILDEATSALDNQTEKGILNSLNKLKNKKTIIMIAHRLTTVKNCDKIFFINKGKLIAQGSFEELINTKEFKTFAQL